jgi:hypothetical protein
MSELTPGRSPATTGVALIQYLAQVCRLPRGDVLTFGRGSDCGIVLPNDSHLSRRAGSVTVLEDCVLIRNHSSTKPFLLRPPVGEDRVVEPGAAGASLPDERLEIVLAGLAGTTVRLGVDVRGLARPATLPLKPPGSRSVSTVTTPFPLTAAQQRVLDALCAPMLSAQGAAAAPATYHQIGESLGLSAQYVRNVVKGVREALTGYGVPDLVSDDPGRPEGDFRWSLARYAIRNRWVTAVPSARA